MNKFDYEQINLEPRFCIVNSRSECDTSVKFGKFKFKLPVVPANMESVISEDLAQKLATEGYFYILHRFNVDTLSFIKRMKSLKLVSSISIGVNDDSYELVKSMISNDLVPDFITIDIAHGHSHKMRQMIRFIKDNKMDTFVIAGNVSTREAVMDLQDWGADSIKVGIGPGSACTTWPSTGFGSRNCQGSTIYHCASISEVPIIADGGIKSPSDITKSIVFGATMVMIGGMLAGFKDSPGEIVEVNGGLKKEFWGSASHFQSGKTSRIEGKKILIDFKDRTILEELKFIEECLQSSISYGGGNTLECLNDVRWF